MTLREFLVKNAPRQELERRRRREEWVAAVDRLINQVQQWLKEANADGLLEVFVIEVERQEQGLGTYLAKSLELVYGERIVKVFPVGRSALADLGPFGEPGHQKAEGRVDISNRYDKYHLYRKLTADGETWIVQDHAGVLRLLDKPQFEVILQALLS